ncbi:MAG TPA: phosphoenolpyruvate--protein phosphotransferase [Chloroflexi bacterium]|nr:phosphoenolpyruvate--protein phosphotransferase [Chloroflexota bacterium]
MRQIRGIPASPGIAIGQAWLYRPERVTVEQQRVSDPEVEWLRLQAAVNVVRNRLQALYEKALASVGEEEAEIFLAHQEFLTDQELMRGIRETIFTQKLNAEYAVKAEFDTYAAALAELDDPYLRARAQDLEDVSMQVIRSLQGQESDGSGLLTRPSVIIAEDLTPSDTIQFDKDKILGICIAKGGPTSHTAILARSLGVPAVVSAGFDIEDIERGVLTVVDGDEGTMIMGPALAVLESARQKQAAWQKARSEQLTSAHQPAVTLDGHRVEVAANIGGVDDARKAIEMGAEGVGLFRTEFLYLDRTELLDIEEQVAIYQGVVKVMDGRPLVVRTLDIGGDKSVPYLGLAEEPNPFLGWRGIRMVRERPDILANQFEALLRAGVGGDIRIMLPMVSGPGEVKRAKEILDETVASLKAQGVSMPEKLQFGIMIEVPSAALLAHHLAPLVDFFSIGTNDLTQYTLAVDRTNERVTNLASPYNPAVLQLIARTIEAAHAHGKWVGMCGELAGDVLAVPVLLGMGLDEFSMAASSIPSVKEEIRRWSMARAKEVAQEVLGMAGSTEVLEYLKGLTPS